MIGTLVIKRLKHSKNLNKRHGHLSNFQVFYKGTYWMRTLKRGGRLFNFLKILYMQVYKANKLPRTNNIK